MLKRPALLGKCQRADQHTASCDLGVIPTSSGILDSSPGASEIWSFVLAVAYAGSARGRSPLGSGTKKQDRVNSESQSVFKKRSLSWSLRQRLARVVRRTVSFSKSVVMLHPRGCSLFSIATIERGPSCLSEPLPCFARVSRSPSHRSSAVDRVAILSYQQYRALAIWF
jgi:hypothetical protein